MPRLRVNGCHQKIESQFHLFLFKTVFEVF